MYIYIYILVLSSISRQCYLAFYWSLSDCKFSHISRTFPSIPANLSNALIWIFSALALPAPLLSLWRLFRVHQLQLVSLSPIVP